MAILTLEQRAENLSSALLDRENPMYELAWSHFFLFMEFYTDRGKPQKENAVPIVELAEPQSVVKGLAGIIVIEHALSLVVDRIEHGQGPKPQLPVTYASLKACRDYLMQRAEEGAALLTWA